MPENPNPEGRGYNTSEDFSEVVLDSAGNELTPDDVTALKKAFASGSGINPFRRFVCLSDQFRASLYDLLESAHPEVLTERADPQWPQTVSSIMSAFLRQQLMRNKVEVNDDVFNMLFLDFVGSRQFHLRKASRAQKGDTSN